MFKLFNKNKPLSEKKFLSGFFLIFFFIVFLFLLPTILINALKHKNVDHLGSFPVTVDPRNKQITESPEVNAYLEKNHDLLAGAGKSVVFLNFLQEITEIFSRIPILKNLSAVGSEKVVILNPGLRKEQVAEIFAKKLNWDAKEKKEFLAYVLVSSTEPISEGIFFPDTYVISSEASPNDVKNIVKERFNEEVLSHYGTSTAEIIPLKQALTIASLIQKETITTDGMRLISGILWNRLFNDMKLQIDSTLQYAEANSKNTTTWWPTVEPADKFIKSPYNTYLNKGLPPEPIANPSVAAILAALNPIKTDCFYYFNDKEGKFHCSKTYKEHKKLLKEYYDQ